MIPKFFSEGDARDPGYVFQRDSPERKHVRDAIECMWVRFAPYCADDLSHFVSDARASFNQRTWELRLACTMLDKGFELRKPPKDGPDICAIADGKPLWIEATAPRPGTGPDAPPAERRLKIGLDRDA